MDKEFIKKCMQQMSDSVALEGYVQDALKGHIPMTHNGKGYSITVELKRPTIIRLPNKHLKDGGMPDKSENIFRVSVTPMNELAKVVSGTTGTIEEVMAQFEDVILKIESHYKDRDARVAARDASKSPSR